MLLVAACTSWCGLGRQGIMTWDEGIYYDEARFVVQAVNALRTGGDIAHATSGFAPRQARPLNVALNTLGEAVFGIHPWVPAALAGLWGVLCICGTYVLGRRVFGERVGLFAAFLLLISPYFLQYRRMGLPEAAGTLAALLILLRLLALHDRPERRPWLNSLGLGLMLGVAVTINVRVGVLLPVVALFRLWWLPGDKPAGRLAGHALLLLAGVAALMAFCETPYCLLPLFIHSPTPLFSYFGQLAHFAGATQEAGRPSLLTAALAPLLFLLYFEAPGLLLGLVAVTRRQIWRHPQALLLLACLGAQGLALYHYVPYARYLSWVLPALMVLAAYGLTRLTDGLPPRARMVAVAGLLLVCLAHASFRAVPILQAHGAMHEAAAWLASRPVGAVVTSDASIAMDYTDLPLVQLPDGAEEARAVIARADAHGPSYVLLDRQQFMAGTFVMTGDSYVRSAGGVISRAVAPQWTARQFRRLFMPFCFEHNRDTLQTLRTGRIFARDGEAISIYTAPDALRALEGRVPR